jgi:hypothetical protein
MKNRDPAIILQTQGGQDCNAAFLARTIAFRASVRWLRRCKNLFRNRSSASFSLRPLVVCRLLTRCMEINSTTEMIAITAITSIASFYLLINPAMGRGASSTT